MPRYEIAVMPRPMQKQRATLIGTLAIGLWASLAALTTAAGTIPAFELLSLSFFIGGVAGLGVVGLRGRLARLKAPVAVWAVGVGGLFTYHACYFLALRLAPPAPASLINYLWPLLIVLLSGLLPGETLQPRHILGALTAFAGVVVLIYARGINFHADARALAGFALALCAAVVWAVYSVVSRRFGDVPSDPVAGFCLVTALLAGLLHIAFEPTIVPHSFGPWLAIIVLGLGPVGLAFYVWDYGVKHGDIRFLGVASYAAPVLSTLLLVICGYAAPSLSLALAAGLIVAGALIARRTT